MLCTNPPPKRVVTFALRCSSRMTVSEPETSGASRRRSARTPKSWVTVSRVPAGFSPAPAPQPADSAASAPRSASSAAGRRRPGLANVEDTAVATALAHAVAVERPVDRHDVEHVMAARQLLREQVVDRAAVADREEEPAAALRADEPLAPPAVGRAAVAGPPGEADLQGADAR